jgi:hypothetical protein
VQVVALLGLEGSRQELLHEWLMAAALAAGHTLVPTATVGLFFLL